jgi:hypothetical protein
VYRCVAKCPDLGDLLYRQTSKTDLPASYATSETSPEDRLKVLWAHPNVCLCREHFVALAVAA